MKSTLLSLSVLLLTFSVGITIPLFLQTQPSAESLSPVQLTGVGSVVYSGCPNEVEPMKGGHIVVSIPNDDEFYLEKRRVTLAEISHRVTKLMRNQPRNQVIYIKSAASVKFETVMLVSDQLRQTNKCIEFVLDKKKGFAAEQSPRTPGPSAPSHRKTARFRSFLKRF
jgi:biopolymer transport protein ExbD